MAPVTGEDLKRLQDHFLDRGKQILRDDNRLPPVGFVITLHKHIEKLLESGWGIEFIDPKACLRDPQDDSIATVMIDLAMDYKRLYHAILNVFPKTRDVLPPLIALAEKMRIDDPYKLTMQPFLERTQMHQKDIIAATMRHVCDKVDAFACVMQSEAWIRTIDASDDAKQIAAAAGAKGLGQDTKSVEVLFSSMETYDFARMVTVPIRRRPGKNRDDGKLRGFGEPTEVIDHPDSDLVLRRRMARFLKPLPEAS